MDSSPRHADCHAESAAGGPTRRCNPTCCCWPPAWHREPGRRTTRSWHGGVGVSDVYLTITSFVPQPWTAMQLLGLSPPPLSLPRRRRVFALLSRLVCSGVCA